MSSVMQDAPPEAQQAAGSGSYPSQGDPAISLIAQAGDLIQKFIGAEVDPQKKAEGAKLLAACHAIISGHEKAHDSAIGMSPALKMVQRQVALRAAQGGAQAPPPGAGGV